MVPLSRSKLALIGAAALVILSLALAAVSTRATGIALDNLATRTVLLEGAVEATAQVLEGTRQLELQRDSIEAVAQREHALRVRAEHRSDSLRGKFAELAILAPDTCGPVVAAAREALREADAVTEHLRGELAASEASKDNVIVQRDSALAALGRLSAAAGDVVVASRAVTHPSLAHRTISFLAKLSPKIGVGGAVGVDPMTNRFSKTVGLTAGWSF